MRPSFDTKLTILNKAIAYLKLSMGFTDIGDIDKKLVFTSLTDGLLMLADISNRAVKRFPESLTSGTRLVLILNNLNSSNFDAIDHYVFKIMLLNGLLRGHIRTDEDMGKIHAALLNTAENRNAAVELLFMLIPMLSNHQLVELITPTSRQNQCLRLVLSEDEYQILCKDIEANLPKMSAQTLVFLLGVSASISNPASADSNSTPVSTAFSRFVTHPHFNSKVTGAIINFMPPLDLTQMITATGSPIYTTSASTADTTAADTVATGSGYSGVLPYQA